MHRRAQATTGYSNFEPSVRFRPHFAISPDGTELAYVDDANGQFNLAVRPLSGGPPRRLTAYTDLSVRRVGWHPGGRTLVYIADSGGNEQHQIYLVDRDGSAPRPLTDSPGVHFWTADEPFSPNGRFLAYAANDRTPAEQDVLAHDLHNGKVRRLYAGGGRNYAGRWSPDGTRLTVTNWRGATTDQTILVVSVEDGKLVRLTPEDAPFTYVPGPWLPDGSGVLVLTNAGRDFTGLAILDAESGDLSWIDTPDWDVESVATSGDGRVLAWNVNVDGESQLRARDLIANRDLPTPKLPGGAAQSLVLAPDGRSAMTLVSTPTRPANLLVTDLGSDEWRWTTDARPATDEAAMTEPVAIRFPARDGSSIPAYLYRPSSASDPVGVVIAVHGGPPTQERPTYSNDGLFQYLVSRGVAVLAPNIRGSSGYGLAYQRAVHRDWGGVDLNDLDDAVRYLKEQPWVDPSRLGLMGRSYGGFVVLSAVSRLPEHGWAAAVAWCAPSNLHAFSLVQPPSWRSQVAILIGDPDTDEEFLLSRSPATYTDRIEAPLFLIQGANDYRVPQPESDQIVETLRARGVDVRYDVYDDEGHHFGKRENQSKARSDAAEFLVARLAERNNSSRL